MRIGVVHSSPEAVRMLSEFIGSRPGYEISWVACNGAEAIEKSASDTPDLLLMDLRLSGEPGTKATRTIMKKFPCPILIVTPAANEKAGEVFEAMGDGALDVVSAPDLDGKGTAKGKEELLKKIAVIKKLMRREERPMSGAGKSCAGLANPGLPLVAIGSSTGGPKALAEILSGLPTGFQASIVIVQHLDVQFAGGLVDWLDQQTPLKVVLAGADTKPREGTVYVAGTNDHLILGTDQAFHYVSEPRDYPYRPSVDRFFISARDNWLTRGVGVLLTGMGRDGANGLLALREAGWHTIAQDEATSVVFGMPKAAAECGGAVDVLSLDRIGAAIMANLKGKEDKSVCGHER
jgi:two-component system, chemotaxis family, response regulator WspF